MIGTIIFKENNSIFVTLIIYYLVRRIIIMKKPKDKSKGIFAEFKKFITRGNIIDLAVGVIIGGAFSAIVTSLTNKIIMPLINLIINAATGGKGIDLVTILNGTERFLESGEANPQCIYIDWGNFIQATINFFLIAVVLFIIIKVINTINDKKAALEKARLEKYYEEHPEEKPVEKPAEPTELDVLKDIKELLKEEKQKK